MRHHWHCIRCDRPIKHNHGRDIDGELIRWPAKGMFCSKYCANWEKTAREHDALQRKKKEAVAKREAASRPECGQNADELQRLRGKLLDAHLELKEYRQQMEFVVKELGTELGDYGVEESHKEPPWCGVAKLASERDEAREALAKLKARVLEVLPPLSHIEEHFIPYNDWEVLSELRQEVCDGFDPAKYVLLEREWLDRTTSAINKDLPCPEGYYFLALESIRKKASLDA